MGCIDSDGPMAPTTSGTSTTGTTGISQVSLVSNNVFSDGASLQLATTAGSVLSGYTATLTVAI
jgi:hypothetical protein